jgi:putative transposase
MKAIKGAVARHCKELLGRTGRFWQPDSYDHIVRTLEQLAHFREYIAENPEKAGIVLAAEAQYHASWMDDWRS